MPHKKILFSDIPDAKITKAIKDDLRDIKRGFPKEHGFKLHKK